MSVHDYWEGWVDMCKKSNKLPETVEYGFKVGEGDCITGAITSEGMIITSSEFDELDDDTRVSMLYVRRRNGQMDLITHDTVYMNVYPASYKSGGVDD